MSPRLGPVEPSPPEPASTLLPDLLADLADWGVQLGGRSYTRVSVEMLVRDLRRSVPSAVGYTLRLLTEPGLPEVSITVAERRLTTADVASTLAFDLPVAHGIVAAATFYAGDADAFDQLAALLGSSVAFGDGAVVLGSSLDADLRPGVAGLEDHTRVNHALGVLLVRGRSVDQARQHLDRLAAQLGTLDAAATHVMSTVGG